jgi:hypothetical protein
LRELCDAAGDKPSLAIAMAGLVNDHVLQGRAREASRLASEAWAYSCGQRVRPIGESLVAQHFLTSRPACIRCHASLVEFPDTVIDQLGHGAILRW